MANTLTAIIPTIFAGLDTVSRELIGIIPAVSRDSTVDRVALGETVTVPVAPAATGGDVVAGSNPPDDGDQTIGSVPLTIDKSKYSPVRWNGEEQLAVGPTGQYNKILADQFTQSFRWLVNQIEADLMTTAYLNASRAYGTAGTAPFGIVDDLDDFAGINRILDDNGAPMFGRQLIAGGAARQNLEGKQKIFFKANEAGTDGLLRDRNLTRALNFDLGYTHAAQNHTKGTGAGYLVNGTPAVGATTVSADVGTGTIIQGDIVTFAGDTNKYVVSEALAGGSFKISAPGVVLAPADNSAISIGADYTANVSFSENAIVLGARAPALPKGGDSADDRMFITDPISNLIFEVSLYREYRRIRYEVAIAWGTNAVKSNHINILLG